MNTLTDEHRRALDLRVKRWTVRAIGFSILMVASCAWLVRNEQSFLPAFAIQTLAAFLFVGLILAAITLGFIVGDFVGRLKLVLGVIVGLVVGAAAFMFVSLLSTEIPILGPAIDRIVSLAG